MSSYKTRAEDSRYDATGNRTGTTEWRGLFLGKEAATLEYMAVLKRDFEALKDRLTQEQQADFLNRIAQAGNEFSAADVYEKTADLKREEAEGHWQTAERDFALECWDGAMAEYDLAAPLFAQASQNYAWALDKVNLAGYRLNLAKAILFPEE